MNNYDRKSQAYRMALDRYFNQLRKYRLLTILVWTLPGIGGIFVFYVPPMIISKMIQRFDGSTFTLNQATPYIVLMAGLWLFGELLYRIAFICMNRLVSKSMSNLYNEGLENLTAKDPSFFQDNFAGSLTKKLLGFGRNFEVFMDTLTFSVFSYIIPFIFVLFVLWQKSPTLMILLFVSLILMVSIILPLAKKRKKLIDVREDAANLMAGHLADVISNMPAVHAFSKEQDEIAYNKELVDDLAKKALVSWDYHTLKIDSTISPMYVMINIFGLILAISVGQDSSQIAAIFLSFSYFGQATRTLWEFNRIYRNIENSLSDASQFTELLLDKPKIIDPLTPINSPIKSGEISFNKVSFRYGGSSNQTLFNSLNLQIKPGEKIALVGPSGGGKSTITKLLLRFEDVTTGSIIIDGSPITEISRKHLRESISYVPQDPQMFHRSILDNIKYGNSEADLNEVIDVAKKAHADEFISKLNHKYDTLVGERGTKLSGGQRQRIAIARAMLKDAPILVLDEATSALDSGSEILIQDALWQLMKDKTTIVIAHRLSTIQKMDRIIVLDEGKIVEEGSHKDLIKKKNGLYARLWEHQSGGFLQD
jgi:ATP-binding cassette subfamily B protein